MNPFYQELPFLIYGAYVGGHIFNEAALWLDTYDNYRFIFVVIGIVLSHYIFRLFKLSKKIAIKIECEKIKIKDDEITDEDLIPCLDSLMMYSLVAGLLLFFYLTNPTINSYNVLQRPIYDPANYLFYCIDFFIYMIPIIAATLFHERFILATIIFVFTLAGIGLILFFIYFFSSIGYFILSSIIQWLIH